jgi:hypothetical protein
MLSSVANIFRNNQQIFLVQASMAIGQGYANPAKCPINGWIASCALSSDQHFGFDRVTHASATIGCRLMLCRYKAPFRRCADMGYPMALGLGFLRLSGAFGGIASCWSGKCPRKCPQNVRIVGALCGIIAVNRRQYLTNNWQILNTFRDVGGCVDGAPKTLKLGTQIIGKFLSTFHPETMLQVYLDLIAPSSKSSFALAE